MDMKIKSEPDIYEDTISESAEFIDEKPNELIIPKTNTNPVPNVCNKKLKTKRKTKDIQGYECVMEKARDTIQNNTLEITKHNISELSVYHRKKLFKIFQDKGCNPTTVAKYVKGCNLKVEDVNDFFDQVAKEAQDHVYQECDSLSFSNTAKWLKYFEAVGISNECNYEAAIAMNAIANNEYHPEPQLMDGVNLKAIYKYLSNALMGLPQDQLDEASAKFLSNEFHNLINEANTEKADNDVRNMKRKIENSIYCTTNQKSNRLDPLDTSTEELERCYLANFKYNNIKYQ